MRASELEPGNERFVYVYAVALRDLGYPDKARKVAIAMQQSFGNTATVMELLRSIDASGDTN